MGELNLIPYVLRERKSKNKFIFKALAISIVIFVVLFGSLIAPRIFLKVLKDKQEELSAEIAQNSAVMQENTKLKEEAANLKGYTDKVDMLTKGKDVVSGKIRGLEKYIKSDISLDSVDLTGNIITIIGRTKNYNSISEFGANLQMSKEYSQSYINSISLDQQTGDYIFTINSTYNGGAVK